MVNNKFGANTRMFISYEIGIMIGVIDNSPTNVHLVESVERLCKKVTTNNIIVADGIYSYGKENGVKYNTEQLNELLVEYGLGEMEF